MELSAIRSRLVQTENTEAELKLELNNLEAITDKQLSKMEAEKLSFHSKQKQGKLGDR